MSQPETSIAEAETGTVLTHPLDEFCRLAKRPLPGIERVDGAALPEPYRSLLVHERDMTSTLGQFHGDDIGLKVLHRHNGGDAFFREVLLLANRDWRPVEYGAIDYGIGHLSRPSGFLRVECDDHIGGLFELGDRPVLFGRRNTLYDATGKRCLAEIVEILPPA